jgi:CDP-diacylglycerol--glycerol-3-phosphate 3-phosphatidyltransferase
MKSDERIKRVLSHPNTLTLFRVVAVPIVVILMIYPNRVFTALAALLFSAAAITDYLDGYLAPTARSRNDFGQGDGSGGGQTCWYHRPLS